MHNTDSGEVVAVNFSDAGCRVVSSSFVTNQAIGSLNGHLHLLTHQHVVLNNYANHISND